MRIPERLDAKIREVHEVQAWVSGAISDFEPWLRNSHFVFFPEYTDHSSDHVEQILITASSIIRDEAWEVMTPEDAGILVLATLLHDCAMHLTEDGFNQLISEEGNSRIIKGFNDLPWSQLWENFLFSAKRFDAQKLIELFGTSDPVRRPPKNPDEMTNRDKKLIGEFLRRYHPRLAHEIALFGVPNPLHESCIQLPEKLGEDFADIAGLVARSHGMPLRGTFEYLKKYNLRDYGGVHAVFLMAVLRVADYLQIQAERAPRQMLRVQKLRSSISKKEWDVHQSIRGIQNNEDDPEAIYIQTKRGKPEKVEIYLRLKDWLQGIQSELDTCWAVFGEVYARNNLESLGLVIRRVRSNLDDEEQFAESVNYIPQQLAFSLAKSETLGLLVRPLYGDKPEVGIRELVQNAVDAVRELEDLLREKPKELEEIKKIKPLNQDADVVVWVDEPNNNGIAKVIISDRGIGMTEDVITNYFLKAGATFRKSEIWVNQHGVKTDEDLEQQNIQSRVFRTGRFGIGALAAFLLGDQIKVSTRHIDSKIGFHFEARLDSEFIEVYRKSEILVGTTIEIAISQECYEQLSHNTNNWDWYYLDHPKVTRLLGKKQKLLKHTKMVSESKGQVLRGWHSINVPGFDSVYWTYLNHRKKEEKDFFLNHQNNLICNGIRAGSKLNLENFSNKLRINVPYLSILDRNGNSPFNLTRSEVDFRGSCLETKLIIELITYFFSVLISKTPKNNNPSGFIKLFNRGDLFDNRLISPYFCTRNGLSFPANSLFRKNKINSVFLVTESELIVNYQLVNSYCHTYDAYLFCKDGDLAFSQNRRVEFKVAGIFNILCLFFKDLILEGKSLEYYLGIPWGFGKTERDIYVESEGLRILTNNSNREVEKKIVDMKNGLRELDIIEIEWSNEQLLVLRIGKCPSTQLDYEFVASTILSSIDLSHQLGCGEGPVFIAELFLKGTQSEPGLVSRLWDEIIKEPVIPFDLEERKSKLVHAYEVLKPYLEEHETRG